MYKIAVLPGDGIGVEIVPEAIKALQVVGERFNQQFQFTEALVGEQLTMLSAIPCPKARCNSVGNLMRCFWEPSVVLNGSNCQFTCARK